ncbi:EAL domain-containing protein [Roseofilum reptotaenium CS-1145]|uniref:EAL domain-containing protein n=1 Tax=Roseofilum reptotaenium TaxID=1233427 RepID=UPI000AD06B61|nr:EAL domain-containing protein [Roseofilum reptotaenium]MDB9518794.1 EAL domain-containing protein [Roseofilum reptotaenium CS-1145]
MQLNSSGLKVKKIDAWVNWSKSIDELISEQRYGVEYQPIVEVKSQEIYGFECLARFFDASNQAIPPDIVYRALHNTPLQLCEVEYQQKILQLAHAPKKTKLFVNLDQDSYFSCSREQCKTHSGKNPFVELFHNYQNSEGIVVELIENTEINHAMMSLSMIHELSNATIETALDDVCNPQSMISTSVMQLVDFIKLDRYVVQNKQNKNLICLVQFLTNYVHGTEKKIILEGVETEEDLAFAQRMQIDYVQGFLYRDRFINLS